MQPISCGANSSCRYQSENTTIPDADVIIKVDEDLPNLAVEALIEHGYPAKGVYEQGMSGWKDHQLWQAIQDEGRYLVTADKGFADIRNYPPGLHGGVMLLRPDQDGIRPMLQLLDAVLEQYDLNMLVGAITVVTPRGVRVRRQR
jgi:predicted nuclease of predicted toxin-antitoxin system